jgi:hypothetical protein
VAEPISRQGRNREYPICDKEKPTVWFGEMGVEGGGTIRPGKHDAESRAPEKRFLTPFSRLTSLQQRLVKTGGRLIKRARYYWLLLAESHLTRRLFGAILDRIAALLSSASQASRRQAGFQTTSREEGRKGAGGIGRERGKLVVSQSRKW